MRCAGGGGDVLAGAGAGINEAASAQFLQGCSIMGEALTLIVGREWPSAIRAFAPIKSEPAQVFQHCGDKFRFAAGAVQVFVAQNQSAAASAGAFLGNPESSGVSQV